MSARRQTRPGEVGISMGPITAPLAEQLAEQGLVIGDPAVLERLERARTSISYLNIQGFIPDGQAAKAREKLMRRIVEAIEKTPQETPCVTSTTS